jgi:hypothetical protein
VPEHGNLSTSVDGLTSAALVPEHRENGRGEFTSPRNSKSILKIPGTETGQDTLPVRIYIARPARSQSLILTLSPSSQ